MKYTFLLLIVLAALMGCAKDEITIYNDYGGSSSDSTGYYNIFYHDFEPDIALGTNIDNITGTGAFTMDFNNDGVLDLGFGYENSKITIGGGSQIIIDNQCDVSSSENLIASLDTGFFVQSTLDPNYYNWVLHHNVSSSTAYKLFEVSGCAALNGEVYIGLRSRQDNNTNINTTNPNYGWLRLEVFNNGDSVLLKDYAYNLIENSPIRVGSK